MSKYIKFSTAASMMPAIPGMLKDTNVRIMRNEISLSRLHTRLLNADKNMFIKSELGTKTTVA